MSNKKAKLRLFRATLAAMSIVPATTKAGVCGTNCCKGHINEITTQTASIWFEFDGEAAAKANLTACTPDAGKYFTLLTTHHFYEEVLAILRSAQLADRDDPWGRWQHELRGQLRARLLTISLQPLGSSIATAGVLEC